MEKRFGVVSIAVALASTLVVGACDLGRMVQQITAEKAMVATVLATPEISLTPSAMAGWDGGFDSGGLDAGQVTIPAQTAAFVFFGERSSTSLDAPPSPLPGADVFIREDASARLPLDETGEGTYALSSNQNAALEYTSGASYDFEAVLQGKTYVGRVENAPQIEQVADLHPPSGYIRHAANEPFTFTRPAPPQGQERNLGFITVYPVDDRGEKGQPTYTNTPNKPLEFLELMADPSQWRQAQVTVPGSAFPNAQQTYVLVLQAVKMGGPESSNLFTGSAILAGTAEVGVFWTH
jgi:hypothetical protein